MSKWIEGERPCRVLVIEDNDADIFLIREALDQAGLVTELTTFSDGAEALQFIERVGRDPHAVQPDIVLLDMHVPKNNGKELLDALRKTPYMADVPVAVVTSAVAMQDRVRALDVQRYIVKPLDLDEFMQIGTVVRDMLGGVHACTGK